MTVYVFLGPTLPHEDAARELDAVYLPPVAQGDVIRIAECKPKAIGIIDGFFESVPAVWHKEILHAIRCGIPVFGASSMGALRAAELHPFGMIGIGAIFEAFRDGRLEDDDEVAVIHGPAELGYPVLSEAMVNIRRTLSDAVADGAATPEFGRFLESLAKELPYRERGWGRVLRRAAEAGIPAAMVEDFRRWLPRGRVDQKREDALAMLRHLRRWLDDERPAPVARFHFEHTLLWEQAARDARGMAA